MQVTAIYPGTFDPMTLGHVDIVKRASRMFDHLVIGIAASPKKNPLFDLDKRVSMTSEIVSEFGNIDIKPFSGLTVDLAREVGANVIVRGLRAISDFDFEVQIAGMNRQLNADVETIFISAAQEYTFLSSSLIREISSHNGDISKFVHPVVLQAFESLSAGE